LRPVPEAAAFEPENGAESDGSAKLLGKSGIYVGIVAGEQRRGSLNQRA